MSGPYCKTCDYYRPMPFDSAECTDPSKIIYVGKGDRVNSEPIVRPDWECSNHTGLVTTPSADEVIAEIEAIPHYYEYGPIKIDDVIAAVRRAYKNK